MRSFTLALIMVASGCATSAAPPPALTSGLGAADVPGNLGDIASADAPDAPTDTDTASMCPPSCEDGNPCTIDSCNPATGCVHADSTGPVCDDGDACSSGDACQAGKCVGQPRVCDDEKPCTTDICEFAAGCVHAAKSAGAPCNDGNACSASDHCVGAICVGDGLKSCDDGKACTADPCDPGTGVCLHLPLDGACEDGDPCTAGDSCSAGSCKPGKKQCDDGNPCTVDGCGGAGCVFAPAPGPCDDGNACTLGDACKAGACAAGLPTGCDDGNACTADSCNKSTGSCSNMAQPGPCDDGNSCTAGEACAGGACAAPPAADCADGNPCTIDSCTAGGCAHKPASGMVCEDGDKCTTADSCVEGLCIPGPAKKCDDGVTCTADTCENGLCKHNPADGIKCTEDGKICTDDVCVAGACVHLPNIATCEDGDQCTDNDACSGGKCAPGKKNLCNDNNPCTKDLCDKSAGCYHDNNDFAVCTSGSSECPVGQCAGGNCQSKPNVTCKTTIDVDLCSTSVQVAGVCTASGQCVPTKEGNSACTKPCAGICVKCFGIEVCNPY